ncbi:MAG: GtrA family protein, partial [Acidimicrobiales bacterium]
MKPLSRFAVAGSAVTAADVGVYTALRAAGAGILAADVPALAVASGLSWGLHRAVTFRGDPYRRWLDNRGGFAVAAVAAAGVD